MNLKKSMYLGLAVAAMLSLVDILDISSYATNPSMLSKEFATSVGQTDLPYPVVK